MKNEYLLRITDTTNEKMREVKWFVNVPFKTAIYEAEKYIEENTSLNNNFHSGINISILSKENGSNICRRMKWNVPVFSNGTGYFKDWDYYKNGILIEASKDKKIVETHLAPMFFGVFFLMSFLISIAMLNSNNEYLQFLGFMNFLIGLIYSGITTLIRANFNVIAETRKQVVFYNLELELPILLAAASTFINFFKNEIAAEIPLGLGGILILSTLWVGAKIFFNIYFDFDKLHAKNLKG